MSKQTSIKGENGLQKWLKREILQLLWFCFEMAHPIRVAIIYSVENGGVMGQVESWNQQLQLESHALK